MQSEAKTVKEYLAGLEVEPRAALTKLRASIKKNLPKGFVENISYGHIGYVVPHSIYSSGYHCNPKLPLPFLSIASQKNFVAVYHMAIYADPSLHKWFVGAYAKRVSTKLNMGKSCIRFKNLDAVPYELIGELVSKLSVADWVRLYEQNLKKSATKNSK